MRAVLESIAYRIALAYDMLIKERNAKYNCIMYVVFSIIIRNSILQISHSQIFISIKIIESWELVK